MNARLKLLGYFLSEMSIFLLAISAWSGAAGNPALQLAVGIGTIFAIIGMAMRWAAYWRKHRRKEHKQHQAPAP